MKKIRDTSGASIVIALVFFLICGIVGSAVVTAASVQAKAAQTHRQLQQDEFNVASAAQSIGYDMDMVELTVQPGENGAAGTVVPERGYSQFGSQFWTQYGSTIMANRRNDAPTNVPDILSIQVSGYGDLRPVYGKVTVDPDLNITIKLSLSNTFASTSPYNMKVTLQCVPSYDNAGNLLSFRYERAILQKEGGV